MKQISNNVFCDDYISNLKLDTKLMANPYYDYPYLIIKNFFSKSICNDIANYTFNASEVHKAQVKTRLLSSVVAPSIDESIRKTAIHTLPNIFLDMYEENFKVHQAKIEDYFSLALTTSTKVQTLEYTKGSFYIKHADDSSELVNKNGQTVGFTQVAPLRKLSSILFSTSHDTHTSDIHSFKGGELLFNYLFDKEGNQVKIYPEAGDMIVFPSNPIYSHEVLHVDDGYRLSLVQWHNAIIN
ncbi:2OG-Fe(II) oxygenase [Sulfurimonas sp.]|nr:2OG-Fe(II) oxygenase [Sulfurimonas sp.]